VALLSLERTALAAGKVRAYKSSFVPTPASLEADFVAAEADFVGYAPIVLGAWSAVGVDSAGQAQTVSADIFFQATDATTPNLIGGLWLTTAADGIYEYCPFPVPLPMNYALAFISANWHLRQPGAGYCDVEN
jgi:hypothetical protein